MYLSIYLYNIDSVNICNPMSKNEKILATFRINFEEWEDFKKACTKSGSYASTVLNDFVRSYIAGNRIDETNTIDANFQDSLDKLAEFIDNRIDANNATMLTRFDDMIAEIKASIHALEVKQLARSMKR